MIRAMNYDGRYSQATSESELGALTEKRNWLEHQRYILDHYEKHVKAIEERIKERDHKLKTSNFDPESFKKVVGLTPDEFLKQRPWAGNAGLDNFEKWKNMLDNQWTWNPQI